MASHSKTTSSNRRKAPRRTMTIGVRLTPDEIAAVDSFMAGRTDCWSRAGAVALLAISKLSDRQAETRRTARPRP